MWHKVYEIRKMWDKFVIDLFKFQTRLEGGACLSEYFFKGPIANNVFLVFSVSWFFTSYAVPCSCFFILYGMVAITMQRRKQDNQFESNRFNNFGPMVKSKLIFFYCFSYLSSSICQMWMVWNNFESAIVKFLMVLKNLPHLLWMQILT